MRWINLHSIMTQFEVMIQVTYVATVMNVVVFVFGLQINSQAVASVVCDEGVCYQSSQQTIDLYPG